MYEKDTKFKHRQQYPTMPNYFFSFALFTLLLLGIIDASSSTPTNDLSQRRMTLTSLKTVSIDTGDDSRRILSSLPSCVVDNNNSNKKSIIETNSMSIKKSTNTTNNEHGIQTSWTSFTANHIICFLQTCVKAIVKLFVEHKDDYKMLNITNEKVFDMAKKGMSSTLSLFSNISLGVSFMLEKERNNLDYNVIHEIAHLFIVIFLASAIT